MTLLCSATDSQGRRAWISIAISLYVMLVDKMLPACNRNWMLSMQGKWRVKKINAVVVDASNVVVEDTSNVWLICDYIKSARLPAQHSDF